MNTKGLKSLIVTILLLSSVLVSAQDKDNYKFFRPNNNHVSLGYFIGGGLSNSFATIADSHRDIFISETTGYQATLAPRGKWGQSVEVGAFFIPRRGLFRLIDIGIGYRNVKGEERIEAFRDPGGDLSFPDEIISQGEFNYSRVALRLNLQTVTLLGKRTFFHQGPGFYMDKTVALRESFVIPHLGLIDTAPKQMTMASLNYTVGLGIKLSEGKFLDIYAHAPLVSTGGVTDGSRELIYSSAYRNFVVGVRYKWLKATANRLCPAFDSPTSKRKSVTQKSAPRLSLW